VSEQKRKKKTWPITPIGKPRMTRRDKWAKRPAVMRYWAFCEEVRARGMTIPEAGARIEFHIPMPKSWSKKKRKLMNGKPHQQKPDLDNIIKGCMDSVYSEDCTVHEIYAKKVWAETGAIVIEEVLDGKTS
jgi:Holliday junction resolvase RusA-like endonuclease